MNKITESPNAASTESPVREEINRMLEVRQKHGEAARLARRSLDTLILVMRNKTGQSYKVRAFLYSLWNGQAVSLLDAITLDYDLRRCLCDVIMAWGYEARPVDFNNDQSFFYDYVKERVTKAQLWDWFLDMDGGAA